MGCQWFVSSALFGVIHASGRAPPMSSVLPTSQLPGRRAQPSSLGSEGYGKALGKKTSLEFLDSLPETVRPLGLGLLLSLDDPSVHTL